MLNKWISLLLYFLISILIYKIINLTNMTNYLNDYKINTYCKKINLFFIKPKENNKFKTCATPHNCFSSGF